MKLAHIINVTEIDDSKKPAYLHIAQPVTIKTMCLAKHLATDVIDVELFAVKHRDEHVEIPEPFNWAPDLTQYAFDKIENLSKVEPKKPLPCIQDIISSLYQTSNAEFFIYTNLDIGLYPDFYLHVANLIEQGYDAFCINRKTIDKEKNGIVIDETNFELAFTLDGIKHIGLDCFVFKRKIVPKLELGNVFIGFPKIGQVLKTQIEKNSKNFVWVKNQKWTFHLGDDRAGRKTKNIYTIENRKAAKGLFIPCFNMGKKAKLQEMLKALMGKQVL